MKGPSRPQLLLEAEERWRSLMCEPGHACHLYILKWGRCAHPTAYVLPAHKLGGGLIFTASYVSAKAVPELPAVAAGGLHDPAIHSNTGLGRVATPRPGFGIGRTKTLQTWGDPPKDGEARSPKAATWFL